jgi:hypothetical protein
MIDLYDTVKLGVVRMSLHSTSYWYILTSVMNNNNRASVLIYNTETIVAPFNTSPRFEIVFTDRSVTNSTPRITERQPIKKVLFY